MYVIGRLAPEHRSGCAYWSGAVSCEPAPGGALMIIGEATSRTGVLAVDDADVAAGLALWLNTSPALRRPPGAALWCAMPIPEEFGRAA
ncbi:hypothetical protein KHC23_00085 [Ancylobacter dichloromethanicus]|uniref:Uncharacterized protein n=1 Tax=Ancylobacter dichloromethanicus TaxID=518825 RepID=A0A9W6N1A8_9HYPH|nr:hypothetical protein [Ancylobacter dichloromethanicus]MBS7552057.1 hypothetical protein [Ancylobacter dichloromethanicus]GLK74694.1 hypothetical protein GCM10017643_48130 [Ancylobacter dichloromethanicus]